jgi:voltage-gated potassium channel
LKRIKSTIFNLIREDDENNTAANVFDGIIVSLIVINILAVILGTFDLPLWATTALSYVEIVSVIIFTIEYLLRFWCANLTYKDKTPTKARLKFTFSFMGLVDLLAILPFYIPFIIPVDLRILRMLRILRLLRIFKFNRYSGALTAIGEVFKRKKTQLLSSIIVVLMLMIIAAVLMYNIEVEAQPDKFSNAAASFWWAIATLTTVGYGDIYPITILGKILSAIIALLGIGLVAVPTGIISAGFIEQIEQDNKHNANECKKEFCPYCGNKIE